MVHLPQTKCFLENYQYHFHLPISSFHCVKFKKNSSSGSRVMRMPNFWAQNGPFAQMRIFSEKLLMSLVPFIHAYLHDKQSHVLIISTILTIKEYWILIDQEPYFAVTWKPDFSQECSFCRMLMNHKNFHFTQIPDKTNDKIFFKSPKTMFWGHFWAFLIIFAWLGFFPKNTALLHITIYGPLTPC